MEDKDILGFNYDQPKELSSISFNTVNQQHAPQGFSTVESTPASGNYTHVEENQVELNPAPRSQLGVPTNKVFRGNSDKYYEEILGNANFVRGNEFGLDYRGRKTVTEEPQYLDNIAFPSVKPDKDGNVDYLGSDAKIVMRNNSPFYPFPSQKLLKNKSYGAYPHEYQYVKGQPIYNYPYGKQEGIKEGKYNPFLMEGFENKRRYWSKVILALIMTFLILIIYGLFISLRK